MNPLRPSALRRLALALLSLTAASAFALAARAAPTDADLKQARERFAEARKLEDAHKWSEALLLLQRVAEVKTTPQVRFHLALCMENVGMWTQALDLYAQAASEANGDKAVVAEANEHIKKLETATPTITVRVKDPAPGDELLLDNRPIPIDDKALAIRVDPGPHTVMVRRPNAVVAREVFTVEPSSTRRVELSPGPATPTPPLTPPVVPTSDGTSTRRIFGWTAIGVAGASVIATGVFVALRASALDELNGRCPDHHNCDPSVASIVSDGQRDSILVDVFAGVAAASGVTGVVLVLTAPSAPAQPKSGASPPPPASRVEAVPFFGPNAAGLVVRGAL